MTAATALRVPAVGEMAPDFTLTATTGERVTLAQLRGEPFLLAFVPHAFSSVCTKEFCEMTENYSAFRWAHVEEHPGKMRENAEILEHIAEMKT